MVNLLFVISMFGVGASMYVFLFFRLFFSICCLQTTRRYSLRFLWHCEYAGCKYGKNVCFLCFYLFLFVFK
jgi:hypothetical protein